MLYFLLSSLFLLHPTVSSSSSSSKSSKTSKSSKSSKISNGIYDVLIIGGGFSGLYSALRLGESSNSALNIAVLEKETAKSNYLNTGISFNGLPNKHACLGGKLRDYPYQCTVDKVNNPYCPNDGIIWVGDHAVRMPTVQGIFFLAQELGFKDIQTSINDTFGPTEGRVSMNRGFYYNSAFGGELLIKNAYKNEFEREEIISDNSGSLFGNAVFNPINVGKICSNEWVDIKNVFIDTSGSVHGYNAITGGWTIKGVLHGNDPIGFREWLNDEISGGGGFRSFPNGGMSEFIRRMYHKITTHNYADIFCGSKVVEVKKRWKYYEIYTENGMKFKASKILSTITQIELLELGNNGNSKRNIFNKISMMEEANIMNPQGTFTCSQQFETQWYKDLIPTYLNKSKNGGNFSVNTWIANDNCLYRMENFNSPYIRSANVIRSVYVDGGECFKDWEILWNIYKDRPNGNTKIAEIIRKRQAEYFGLDINEIPMAVNTHCNLDYGGWFFLKAGASVILDSINPSEYITNWAMKPLNNENIFMCGESYSHRHTWADGGRVMCDLVLNKYFGVKEKYLKQWDFTLHGQAKCSNLCVESSDPVCDNLPDRALN